MEKRKVNAAVLVIMIPILSFLSFCMIILPVFAEEKKEDAYETIYASKEYEQLDQYLEAEFSKATFSLKDTMSALIKGDVNQALSSVRRALARQFAAEFPELLQVMLRLLVLILLASLLFQYSKIYSNHQVSSMCFLMFYFMIFVIGLKLFSVLMQETIGIVTKLIEFMKLLGPAYFLAVSISKGSYAATGFYAALLGLIYLIEGVMLGALIPITKAGMLIRILNEFTVRPFFSKLAQLFELIVGWGLKTMLALVIGQNVIQGLIGPGIDSLNRTAVLKSVEAVPGIGDAVSGSAQTVLGAAVLIKNAVGVSGMIVILAFCMKPVVEIFLAVLLLRILVAVIEPVSDRRLTECVSGIGKGAEMLLSIVLTTAALFIIMIGISAAYT